MTTNLEMGRLGLVAVLLCATAAQARAGAEFLEDQQSCKHAVADRLADGVTWTGACSNGWAEGEGKQQWSHAGIAAMTYVGTLAHGAWDGKGALFLLNSAEPKYEGGFAQGHFDGRGLMHVPDGGTLEIEFRNDRPASAGVYNGPAGALLAVTLTSKGLRTADGREIPMIAQSAKTACTQQGRPKIRTWPSAALYRAIFMVDDGKVTKVRFITERSSGQEDVDHAIISKIEETIRSTYVCPGTQILEQEFEFRVE